MLFRRVRILRDAEKEQGAGGAKSTGAAGAGNQEPKPEDESINSRAKNLKWVQDLQRDSAELAKLKAEQAEAKRKAEQTALEQKGQYEQALQMEKDGRLKDKAEYDARVKQLSMESSLAQAGFRPEAAKLFIEDFNQTDATAVDFVAKLKADESNAWLLVQQKTRTPNPTKPAGKGPPEEFDPSWIDSDDPAKRQKAIEHNRKAFWEKFHAKDGPAAQ